MAKKEEGINVVQKKNERKKKGHRYTKNHSEQSTQATYKF